MTTLKHPAASLPQTSSEELSDRAVAINEIVRYLNHTDAEDAFVMRLRDRIFCHLMDKAKQRIT